MRRVLEKEGLVNKPMTTCAVCHQNIEFGIPLTGGGVACESCATGIAKRMDAEASSSEKKLTAALKALDEIMTATYGSHNKAWAIAFHAKAKIGQM